jgi:hypothetical protein
MITSEGDLINTLRYCRVYEWSMIKINSSVLFTLVREKQADNSAEARLEALMQKF